MLKFRTLNCHLRRGYDNVLPGQVYHTTQGMAIGGNDGTSHEVTRD
jgi:hypothetical protein